VAIPVGTRLGPYEVLSAIGAGGMGEVYRAHDTLLNRDVALKVLPEAFSRDIERMARFEREAKLLASLNHPNIAAIYGLEISGPTRALVMELVEGPTLADHIRGGAIPVDEALPIAKQVADALEYAHDNNIIHRDLKPANIKVKEDGTVKVLDFGLAKALSDEVAAQDMSNSPTLSMAATRAGVILGTAAYMSPEQARGRKVDRRTDVWAFGVVLFEMLTGKQAFEGEDVSLVLAAVMKSEPAWENLPNDLPPRLRTVLSRCLQKDPKQRLRDIGDARLAMEGAFETAAAAAQSTPAAGPIRRLAVPALVTLSSMLLVVLVALSAWIIALRRSPAEAQAVRFTVGPPGTGSFQPFPNVVTVSPDGSKLAFIASDAPSKPLQIWIRSLDSETAQALPGTENAVQHFWSPDSRFLAFYADGKLKKIAVSGGPAQTLADTPGGGNHGSWSRNGVILFAPSGVSPPTIYRVSAAGGKATPVTTLDASRQETRHYWPYFLPDGNHFLYLATSSDSENNAVFVGSLDSPEKKLLVKVLSNAIYAPPGYLIFNREGALMAQRFDAQRLELAGDEAPIAEDMDFNSANGRTAFSASENGVLTYRTSGGTNTQLTWFDRSGKKLGVLGDPAQYYSLALSPDEKRVAVSITEGNNRDIWIYDVARNLKTRFTFDPATEQEMSWSPDGSRIIFNSSRKGGLLNLYQKASDGSGNEELLYEDTSGSKYPETFSSDGRSILYFTGTASAKAGADILTLPLTGGGSGGSWKAGKPVPFLQTKFNELYARFSPDGRWVAYQSNESGRFEVYVAPYPGPGGKRQISTAGGTEPHWRRDGSELFYFSGSALTIAAVNGKGSSFEVGPVKELFPLPIRVGTYRYDVTADGQRFLANTSSEETSSAPISVVLNWTAGLKK
jgi:serine/threonine protein kinase/Tol biopolymer transport system component